MDHALHNRLEASARAHGTTVNAEAVWRLERSYRLDDVTRPQEEIIANLQETAADLRVAAQAIAIDQAVVDAVRAGNTKLAQALLDENIARQAKREQEEKARQASHPSASGTTATPVSWDKEPGSAFSRTTTHKKRKKKAAAPTKGIQS
jgi:hypothetical protein